MAKSKYIEEKIYNTSDLSFGCYNYRYAANYNGNEYDIVGLRRGILTPVAGGYLDLITNFIISEEDIISKKEFGIKDIPLANSQVINIFKELENDGYLATESILNIDCDIERIITFSAATTCYGYVSKYPGMQAIFENNVKEKSFIKKLFNIKH